MMRMKRRLGVAFLASFTVASTLPARPARAENSLAALAFREGRDALRAGNYELACTKFAASEEAEPSTGARLNLGDCALRQHHYVQAEALYHGAALLTDGEKRAFAEQRAASARALAGTLRLRWAKVKPTSVRVEVDGKTVDTPADLAVDPGRHLIHVIAADADASQTVDVGSGATADVPLAAPSPPPVVMSEPALPPRADPVRMTRSPLPYVLFGASGLALAGGIVTGIVAKGARDDVDTECDGAKPCAAAIFARADVQADYHRAKTYALASTLCFVGAAVTLVAGGAVWLVTSPTPTGATASIAGRF